MHNEYPHPPMFKQFLKIGKWSSITDALKSKRYSHGIQCEQLIIALIIKKLAWIGTYKGGIIMRFDERTPPPWYWLPSMENGIILMNKEALPLKKWRSANKGLLYKWHFFDFDFGESGDMHWYYKSDPDWLPCYWWWAGWKSHNSVKSSCLS